jgi:hypothetical protein
MFTPIIKDMVIIMVMDIMDMYHLIPIMDNIKIGIILVITVDITADIMEVITTDSDYYRTSVFLKISFLLLISNILPFSICYNA